MINKDGRQEGDIDLRIRRSFQQPLRCVVCDENIPNARKASMDGVLTCSVECTVELRKQQ